MSIMSFPERGKWGNSKWRGNCSGHVYKELFERLRPTLFVDPTVGSGTSVEVAAELNIPAIGLDLHCGFNVLRDSILERVGKHADLIISHPPYAGQVIYSSNVWGTEAHPDDLSHCKDDDDFNEKLAVALLNQREATTNGGIYGTIIGDWRRNGVYSSYQAECIARMPRDELVSIVIKAQHNTSSARKQYGKMRFAFIEHEYILLWQRKARSTYHLLSVMATEQAARLHGTWKAIIRNVMISLGGQASLDAIYDTVAAGCPEKVRQNANWQAKVRQVLNSTGDYASKERGVWALA